MWFKYTKYWCLKLFFFFPSWETAPCLNNYHWSKRSFCFSLSMPTECSLVVHLSHLCVPISLQFLRDAFDFIKSPYVGAQLGGMSKVIVCFCLSVGWLVCFSPKSSLPNICCVLLSSNWTASSVQLSCLCRYCLGFAYMTVLMHTVTWWNHILGRGRTSVHLITTSFYIVAQIFK